MENNETVKGWEVVRGGCCLFEIDTQGRRLMRQHLPQPGAKRESQPSAIWAGAPACSRTRRAAVTRQNEEGEQ